MSTCTAFAGSRRIATGEWNQVALEIRKAQDRGEQAMVLIFDDESGRQVELDPRPAVPETRKPGRPRLGVVAREVTLLPRHWEWLATQPGGASVALRQLVEYASRANRTQDRVRIARESAYRFMSAMAGNEPGFEEASRALFAGNREKFEKETAVWPADVRRYAAALASPSW